MERLTRRLADGRVCFKPNLYGRTNKEVCDRLAAYEDTGLEPEEITALIGNDHVKYHLLYEYQQLGTIDYLRELAQADREGRCVVLPESYYTAEAAARKASGPAEQSERGQAAAWIMQRFGRMS